MVLRPFCGIRPGVNLFTSGQLPNHAYHLYIADESEPPNENHLVLYLYFNLTAIMSSYKYSNHVLHNTVNKVAMQGCISLIFLKLGSLEQSYYVYIQNILVDQISKLLAY